MKTVIENGIRKHSFEWTEHRIGNPVQKPFETAVIVRTRQFKDDLKTNHPVTQTKKVIDKLTRPDNQTKPWKINLL